MRLAALTFFVTSVKEGPITERRSKSVSNFMKQFTRIGLFVLTNFLVMLTASIVCSILGVGFGGRGGVSYPALMTICLVWGMTGAFISLALSRAMAKWTMGVQVVDPASPGQFGGLVNMVHEISRRAGLSTMPEVGIYESPDVNAFATGPSRSRSLVAVSTGLLRAMDRQATEGVIAHEVSHIVNGDMVTMTLIQGVVNAFVEFFARIAAMAAAQRVEEREQYMVAALVRVVMSIAFSFLGMMVVAWFSRRREFRADAGSARLVGRESMIAGLQTLQRLHGQADPAAVPASMAALQIDSGQRLSLIFATHPPLSDRIRALQSLPL